MADSRLNPLYLGKEEIMIAIGCDQGGFALKQEIMAYTRILEATVRRVLIILSMPGRYVQQSMMESVTRVFLSAEQE